MKKIILAVIAVMTFGFVNAQDLKFGVKGGINLSNFSGDIDNVSSRVGFQVGGFMEYSLSEKFAIQPEILYSSQGAKNKGTDYYGSYETKFNVNYLIIPIMAKYYIVEKFNVEAGPQIGFLLGGKTKYTEYENDKKYSESYDSKDGFESIDFGVNFGAGYDFTENLSAGLRYNLGLSNILKDADDIKAHSSIFSLSVGYKF